MTKFDPHHQAGSPQVNCRVHDGRTITVTIVDKHTGEPFHEKASVHLSGPSTPGPKTSNANGVAVFHGLPAGRYLARASHPGYGFVPEGLRKDPSDHLTLLAFRKDVRWGVDTNLATIDLETVRKGKKTFICRYLSDDGARIPDPNDPQKQIPAHPQLGPDEIGRYKGIDLVAIWEISKRRAIELGDKNAEYDAGMSDATLALAQLAACGLGSKVIYFTADFTVSKRRWLNRDSELINHYFSGVKKIIGDVTKIGAYGTYVPLMHLLESGHITYAWQMVFGKKGINIDDRVHIYQYDIWPDQNGWGVAGEGALDLDCAVKPQFGQFQI